MKFFSKLIGAAAVTMAITWSAPAAVNLGNLPLWFEAGHDQSAATFVAHAQDSEFSVTKSGAEFVLSKPGSHNESVRMTFVGGAAGAMLAGENVLAGKINYLLGNESAQWRACVPTFARVQLTQIYPSVNVVYYGSQQQLEYDFNLAAGVNPETIAIQFNGAEKISINSQGQLVIQLQAGQIIQHVPIAYQMVGGIRHEIKAGYKILAAGTVTFAIGQFDRAQPLVIDPVLSYSTYFGGNSGDKAWAIAVNPTDNSIYLAGQTFSTQISNNIPFAKNVTYTNFGGGSILGDAFVAKFDSTGTNLIYCTYLGGSADDAAYALTVDSDGHAFVAGATDSTNFPVKNALSYGAFSGTNIHGVIEPTLKVHPLDAFVTELSADGASLVYSTYLGGSSWDSAYAIAIDTVGNAFVTGSTYSSNFPVTAAAVLNHLATTNNFYANYNAFVAEIAANGSTLNYSTYLGGTNRDVGRAIAYNNGYVLVAGSTTSTNFPWVNGLASSRFLNGFPTNATPGSDAFVTMFTTSGTNLALQYSTFLGSTNNDLATGIAADASGNAYVVGWTTSTNFPVTTNGVQLSSYVRTNLTAFVFATNAFLTEISVNGGTAFNAFSQVFGGRGVDVANGVVRDSAGNIFVVGSATSTNLPVTRGTIFGSLRATNFGGSDVFVTAFKSDFSGLLYGAYLGGRQDDFGNAIAVDTDGNAIVTGQTLSTNFPVYGSWSTNFPVSHRMLVGTNDAFIAKILTGTSPVLQAAASGTNVLVYWPAVSDVTPAALGVETTTDLLRPAGTNWVVVTNPVPVLTNGNYTYTFTRTNLMRFFRFHPF